MKKHEAETAIRRLVHKWVEETRENLTPSTLADYYAFKRWAETKGHSVYWSFRSPAGTEYLIELWFDQELKQTSWR